MSVFIVRMHGVTDSRVVQKLYSFLIRYQCCPHVVRYRPNPDLFQVCTSGTKVRNYQAIRLPAIWPEDTGALGLLISFSKELASWDILVGAGDRYFYKGVEIDVIWYSSETSDIFRIRHRKDNRHHSSVRVLRFRFRLAATTTLIAKAS